MTNRAKIQQHLISPTCQVQIIRKYKQHLQVLRTAVELCIAAVLNPDVMRDMVDNIDTVFECYHSIAWSAYCFGVPVFLFELLSILFGSLKW
jgi:hypothetical protein